MFRLITHMDLMIPVAAEEFDTGRIKFVLSCNFFVLETRPSVSTACDTSTLSGLALEIDARPRSMLAMLFRWVRYVNIL